MITDKCPKCGHEHTEIGYIHEPNDCVCVLYQLATVTRQLAAANAEIERLRAESKQQTRVERTDDMGDC